MKNNYHSQNKPIEIIALIQVFLILLLLMSSHIIIYNFTHMQSEVPDLRTFSVTGINPLMVFLAETESRRYK